MLYRWVGALVGLAVMGMAGTANASLIKAMSPDPGPGGIFDIDITIWNIKTRSPIASMWFDLSGTTAIGDHTCVLSCSSSTTLIIDPPPFDIVAPAGGTAVFVPGSPTLFHFDFTSFDAGDHFDFGWDPDIVTNTLYGAIVSEQAGMVISAVLVDGSMFSGTFGCGETAVGPTGCVAEIPEPATLTLFGMGLVVLGFMTRRRRTPRSQS